MTYNEYITTMKAAQLLQITAIDAGVSVYVESSAYKNDEYRCLGVYAFNGVKLLDSVVIFINEDAQRANDKIMTLQKIINN